MYLIYGNTMQRQATANTERFIYKRKKLKFKEIFSLLFWRNVYDFHTWQPWDDPKPGNLFYNEVF